MSILGTMYLLFKSNADDVKKGSEEAKKSTVKLQDQLNSIEGVSKKVGSSFLKLAKDYSGMIVAAVSVGAIVAGISSAVRYAGALGQISSDLGVSIENLDAWGAALKVNGGSAEEFQQTVGKLSAGVEEISKTGTGAMAPVFKRLGVSLRDAQGELKDTISLLPEIASAFEGLSANKSEELGKQLGLDQHTILLLQQGRKAVDEIVTKQKELGSVTAEDAAVAKKFNDQWDNTGRAFQSVFMAVGLWVLPAITAISKGMESTVLFFKKHQGLIIGSLIAIGAGVTYFVLPPLIKMAAAAIVAFFPFIVGTAIVLALAAAFAIAYDDITAFINGGESFIGHIVGKWPVVGTVLKAIGAGFSWLMSKGLMLGKVLWGIFTSPIESLKYLWAQIESFGNMFFDVWDEIIEKIESAFSLFSGISKLINGAKSALGLAVDADVTVKKGQEALASTAINGIASQTSSSIISSNSRSTATKNTTVQTGPITIQTQATDADGIASVFGDSLKAEMRQAVGGFDDGVLA